MYNANKTRALMKEHLKGSENKMILFTILLLIIILLVAFIIFVASVGGALLTIIFSDVIVCIFLIIGLMWLVKKWRYR